MSKSFDVVIAGGGPAGLCAARVLARQGREILVLDRAVFPRPKLCGGLLTHKTMGILERAFGLDVPAMEAADLIDTASRDYSIHHRGRLLLKGRAAHPFRLVRRERLDAHLLRLAREAGAEVREGAAVIGCDPETGTTDLADGTSVTGRFLLGADGANSAVRRAVAPGRAARTAWNRNLAAAIEIAVPRESAPLSTDHPRLDVGLLRTGYGWVFPNRENLIIGICGLRHKSERFAGIFRNYLRLLGFPEDFSPELHGHPLPYGNWLADPARGRVLLAGDAGGFVEPLLGEGIFYALYTGFLAAGAIARALEDNAHPAEVYRRHLRGAVLPELIWSNRLRWMLFTGQRLFGGPPIRAFHALSPGKLAEMVHGTRSFRLLAPKNWD